MIGIIGGSGLYSLNDLVEIESTRCTTIYGEPSSELVRVCLEKDRLQCHQHDDQHDHHHDKENNANGANEPQAMVFLARHGQDHTFPPHRVNYRANIQALYELGVTRVVAVNAVGSCDPLIDVGDIVMPTQLIDYTSGREHTFFDQLEGFDDHIDFTDPFSEPLQNTLMASAAVAKVDIKVGGTYGVTQGPRLETAAEIARLIRDGCTLVGMTAMPEAALARERQLEYASICIVVNKAAGLATETISTTAISEVLAHSTQRIAKVIHGLFKIE